MEMILVVVVVLNFKMLAVGGGVESDL